MQFVQQMVNGLMLGGILAFVAVAFTLTIGMLNFLNFTIPALFMLAGMVTWALSAAGPHFLGLGARGSQRRHEQRLGLGGHPAAPVFTA